MRNKQPAPRQDKVINQIFAEMAFDSPGIKRAQQCIEQPSTNLACPIQEFRPWSAFSHEGEMERGT
jgi:hypothetical protein